MSYVGKILWWNDLRKIGVLTDVSGKQIYFDLSTLKNPSKDKPVEGQCVSFTLDHTSKNVIAASSVEIPPSARRRALNSRFADLLQIENENEINK